MSSDHGAKRADEALPRLSSSMNVPDSSGQVAAGKVLATDMNKSSGVSRMRGYPVSLVWRSVNSPITGDSSPLLTAAIVVLLAALLPILSDSSFQLYRYELVIIYTLVVLGLNFSFGYAGQLALAQPVVMGTSAYVAALLSVDQHWNAWATLVPSVLGGVAMGVLLTLPGLRLRGWYLGIVAFFAVLVFPDVLIGFQTWTGGDNGLGPLPGIPGLGTGLTLYEFILACGAVSWLLLRNLINSTWGINLRSLRESPRAAESLGVNLKFFGIGVVAISSIPVALAGWVFAYTTQIVSPTLFNFNLMLLFIGACMLGGRGSLWGPIIGTIVFETLNLYIGPFSAYNPIFLGVGLLVTATVFPLGVAPLVRNHLRPAVNRWRSRTEQRRYPLPRADVSDLDRRSSPGPRESDTIDGAGVVRGSQVESQLPQDPVLRATGIRKAFGGRVVLDSVDIDLRAGRICGLVGPNGSGKTTILNIITGFVAADAGEVLLGDQLVAGWGPHKVARHGVKRSFQTPQLITELSAGENIRFGLNRAREERSASPLFHSPRYRRQRQTEASEVMRSAHLVGLDDVQLETPVRELSLGTRRIIEIARALISSPTVICLDEPAAGLGGEDLERVRTALLVAAASGTAILLVEHNLAFVRDIANDLIVLDHGIVAERRDLALARVGAGAGPITTEGQPGYQGGHD